MVVKLNFNTPRQTGYGTQIWIDKDGIIFLVGQLNDLYYHVGKTRPGFKHITSNNSIGIEIAGRYKGGRWESLTSAQKKAILSAAGCIIKKYNIPKTNIFSHAEIAYKTPGEGQEAKELILANYDSLIKGGIGNTSISTTSTNTTSNVSATTPTSSGCSGGSCSSTLSSLSNSVTGSSSATPLKPKVATSSTSTSYPDIPGTSTTTDRAMGSSGYAMASNNISIDNEPLTKEAIERNKILKEIHQTLASMDSKLDKQDTPHKEYVASNEKEKNIDVNRRYQDIRDDSPMNLDVYDIV